MSAQARSASSGWAERLERLARLIPGVGRYQDREGLRETDKRVRVLLADQVVEVARTLEPAERRLLDAKRLERLPALDRVRRRLATSADRLRFASYGFAGVFDLHKIREAELSELHQFDLSLLEKIATLRKQVEGLAAAAADAGFAEVLATADAALEQFDRTLDERDRLARGL